MIKKLFTSIYDNFAKSVWYTSTFVLMLIVYLLASVIRFLGKFTPRIIRDKLKRPLNNLHVRISKFSRHSKNTINRGNLIELAIKNMNFKRSRSIITIGGMAVGIGAIVFLVSLGYGLQKLVISRVAKLNEMKQVNIVSQTGSQIKIDDKSLAKFRGISNIEAVLPVIAVVGKVDFQGSVSDMAVYGVTSDYLRQSAIQPVQGDIFESNDIVAEVFGQVSMLEEESEGATEGDEKEMGEIAKEEINFSIYPGEWVRVREGPSTNSETLGYTKRTDDLHLGSEVWGSPYDSDNNNGGVLVGEDKKMGKWIKSPVYIWNRQSCDASEEDCEDGKYLIVKDENMYHAQESGYIAETNFVEIIGSSAVLGVDDDNSIADTSVDWVEIPTESGSDQATKTKFVALPPSAKKEAVVNRAMLKVLGIDEGAAVGEKFNTSFVVTGDLLSDGGDKIESEFAEYVIVGVIPGDKTPVFYVPFVDLRSLGIANYSQATVVLSSQKEVSDARGKIEAMGFATSSVVDTVNQINSLFATIRIILALLGTVALSVAALGMFNTLTVSLLERTREVGLMKAMGMRSSEVRELFLTESMIMGFFGGIVGIVIGYLGGKLVSLVLSAFALFKGVGFVNVSHIPALFVFLILFLALVVGIGTGIYPAKRATKISALDALRYE